MQVVDFKRVNNLPLTGKEEDVKNTLINALKKNRKIFYTPSEREFAREADLAKTKSSMGRSWIKAKSAAGAGMATMTGGMAKMAEVIVEYTPPVVLALFGVATAPITFTMILPALEFYCQYRYGTGFLDEWSNRYSEHKVDKHTMALVKAVNADSKAKA